MKSEEVGKVGLCTNGRAVGLHPADGKLSFIFAHPYVLFSSGRVCLKSTDAFCSCLVVFFKPKPQQVRS